MKTESMYQLDSYLKSFDAQVVEIDEANNGIILDRTAFFPGGGGQPADKGTINHSGESLTVKRAKMISDEIVHILEAATQLPEKSSSINAEIDWEHRYQLMRTHTAMHVLCGVIFRDYGASVTGGNMDPLKGRMDFEFETMRAELVKEIEKAINIEVSNKREVRVYKLPRAEAFQIPDLIRTKINLLPEGIEEVRIVEIEGLDLQADGGTHVKNTAEVGQIRIVDYKSKGKINKRIYVEIDAEV